MQGDFDPTNKPIVGPPEPQEARPAATAASAADEKTSQVAASTGLTTGELIEPPREFKLSAELLTGKYGNITQADLDAIELAARQGLAELESQPAGTVVYLEQKMKLSNGKTYRLEVIFDHSRPPYLVISPNSALGKGTFKTVHKAFSHTGEMFAACRMNVRGPAKKKQREAGVRNETWVLNQMRDHPSFVKLHFFTNLSGDSRRPRSIAGMPVLTQSQTPTAMTLELCQETMSTYLEREKPSLAVRQQMCAILLDGVGALHERQIYWLDPKLENLLMVSRGEGTPPAVRLTDFGTSISPLNPDRTLWDAALETATEKHTLHAYCSPEYETPEMAGLSLWNMKSNRLNTRLTTQLGIDEPPKERQKMLRQAAQQLGRGSKGAMNPEMTTTQLEANLANLYEKQDVYVTGCLLYEILTGDPAPPNLAQLREDSGAKTVLAPMLMKSINYTLDDRTSKTDTEAPTYREVMLSRMQDNGVPESQALAVLSMMEWNPQKRPAVATMQSAFNPDHPS